MKYLILLIIVLCSCHKNTDTIVGNSSVPWFINAPTLFYTIITPQKTILNWQDNSSNEDGFEIWRSLDGINWVIIKTTEKNTTSYDDSEIFNWVSYKVKAFNKVGDKSDWSNQCWIIKFHH